LFDARCLKLAALYDIIKLTHLITSSGLSTFNLLTLYENG
jgi:hypothetical protein